MAPDPRTSAPSPHGLDSCLEACRFLIASRFAPGTAAGAAGMLLADGTVVTGTAPEVLTPSVEMCHETEPFCAAYRIGRPVVASVCLHRTADGTELVLSPCGLCRERLAVHGPDVLVGVPARFGPHTGGVENLGGDASRPLASRLPHGSRCRLTQRVLRLLQRSGGDTMEAIPHRELRNNSSSILARIAGGESFAVTNHGEVAAIITPPAIPTLERLERSGQLRPPRQEAVDFSRLTRVAADSREILDDLRGDR